MSISTLAFNTDHLLHPYTSITNPLPCREVVSASGVYLTLADGQKLIDGVSSWWCMCHGHNAPEIVEAIRMQSEKMCHVMFAGLVHERAAELGEELLAMAPHSMQRIFYAESGSVSVEIALKMAIQYQRGMGHATRHRFLTVKGGYHGDTFATMALCDPEEGMHTMFRGQLSENFFAPRPSCKFASPCDDSSLKEMRVLLELHQAEIAAVILEPIMQGAGGMYLYNPDYLNRLRKLCDEFSVLLIFDEIATGFGRTGKFFATEYTQVEPDLMTVGKGLTGGHLPMSAVLCSEKVAAGIAAGTPGVVMHGPTFMGNPLSCAAGVAAMKLFHAYRWQENVQSIQEQLERELAPALALPNVKEVRALGAMGVIELDRPVDQKILTDFFVRRGVWLRPFDRLIYTMPPFIITQSELSEITSAMCEAAKLHYELSPAAENMV